MTPPKRFGSGQARGPGGRGGRRGAPDPASLSASPCEEPYHFVPVEPELAITDAPVFHDVQRIDEEFWSGELCCTLTALTPLIAANYQFEYQAASEKVKSAYRTLLAERGIQDTVAENKNVFEPLGLPSKDGLLPERVLIKGESLKGMVRHVLQALLSAPMERVYERTFSFRPNIQMVTSENRKVDVVPALVIGGGGWTETGPRPVDILVLSSLADVCYVHPDAEEALPQRIRELLEEPPENRADRYADAGRRRQLLLTQKESQEAAKKAHVTRGNILKPGAAPGLNIEGWLPVVNFNGIDLEARLNELFHQTQEGQSSGRRRIRSPKGYRLLLLQLNEHSQATLDANTLKAFYDSLDHLADDTAGHLRAHPLLGAQEVGPIAERIRRFRRRGLLPGDLVFLERGRSSGGFKSSLAVRDPTTPVSASRRTSPGAAVFCMGHHFYGRTRYRDSIHRTKERSYQNRHLEGSLSELRDILCPRPLEHHTDEGGGPVALSAARLLFGYVGTAQGEYDQREPLTFGIGWSAGAQQRGRSDFAQLAGRISFNMALEQGESDRANRFCNQRYACLVPLRPLGAPKPSAVEVYLTQDRLGQRQDRGTLCTYGDTVDDPSAGNLRGRKFYLHQPDAASNPKCYELVDASQPDWNSGQTVHLLGNQAAIARFVSSPGTEFRFTIRFRDLRSWELGALLFTITADQKLIERLVEGLGMGQLPSGLRSWLNRTSQWLTTAPGAPLLALKLGHGRPLGLGSVSIRVDQVRRLRFDRPEGPRLESYPAEAVRQETVDQFAAKLRTFYGAEKARRWAERVLLPWLQVHRYAGRSRFDYPRASNRTIFGFHAEERKKHAKGRKLSKDGPGPAPGGLKSLNDLEQR